MTSATALNALADRVEAALLRAAAAQIGEG